MIKLLITLLGAVGAVASILALLLYLVEDDSIQPSKGDGIEETRGDNIPGSLKKKENQRPIKDLTLESLESDFSLAKKMSFYTNRDKELMNLITKALQAEKYQFTLKAIEFALAIYFVDNRDKALGMIIEQALSQGHKDIAIRASDELFYMDNADAARKKILEY